MRRRNRRNKNSPAIAKSSTVESMPLPQFSVPCEGYVIGYVSISTKTHKFSAIIQVQIDRKSNTAVNSENLVRVDSDHHQLLTLFSKIKINSLVSSNEERKYRWVSNSFDMLKEGVSSTSPEDEICAVAELNGNVLTVISRSMPSPSFVFSARRDSDYSRHCFVIGTAISPVVPRLCQCKCTLWNGLILFLLRQLCPEEIRAKKSSVTYVHTLRAGSVRRLTKIELENVYSRCRTHRKLDIREANKFILGPHVGVARLEDHLQNQSAKDVTVMKNLNHSIERSCTNQKHILSFKMSPVEVKMCIKKKSLNSWRVGSELTAIHTGQLKNQSVYATVDKIQYNDDGSAMVRLIVAAHSNNLFDMLCRAAADNVWNGWIVGPSQNDFCVVADTLEALFERFFNKHRNLFDMWRGFVLCERIEKDLPSCSRSVTIKGVKTPLDDSQLEAVRVATGTRGWTCVAAPPGSGKTFTISALAGIWKSNKSELHRNYITCATNAAVSNAVEAVKKCYSNIKVVRDFSIKAELEATVEMSAVSLRKMARKAEKYLTKEELNSIAAAIARNLQAEAEINDSVGKNDIATILARLKNLRVAQTELRNSFVDAYAPEVCGATSSIFVIRGKATYERESESETKILRRGRGKQMPKTLTEHLIIDEAAQLSPIEALALYCTLGNCSSITLFGDTKQLGPFTLLEPGSELHQFACEGELTRMENLGQPNVMLKHIYRCHPRIVDLFFKPIYGPSVVGSTSEEKRDIVHKHNLPMCLDRSPCALVQVDADRNSSRMVDLVNRKELNLVFKFILHLRRKRLRGEDVVVICHHRAQKEALIEKMRGMGTIGGRRIIVPVHTIDSFQGKEAKIVIVLTTKTVRSNDAEKGARTLSFVSDERRGCVAVSRAQHGLYVFGDWHGLNMTTFWSKFIPDIVEAGGLMNSEWKHLKKVPSYRQCSLTTSSLLCSTTPKYKNNSERSRQSTESSTSMTSSLFLDDLTETMSKLTITDETAVPKKLTSRMRRRRSKKNQITPREGQDVKIVRAVLSNKQRKKRYAMPLQMKARA